MLLFWWRPVLCAHLKKSWYSHGDSGGKRTNLLVICSSSHVWFHPRKDDSAQGYLLRRPVFGVYGGVWACIHQTACIGFPANIEKAKNGSPLISKETEGVRPFMVWRKKAVFVNTGPLNRNMLVLFRDGF